MSAACPDLDGVEVHDQPVREDAESVDLDAVFRRERDQVFRAVRAVLGPSDEIEDVVQSAFLEAHRSFSSFRGRSRLSTWLYRIAVNVALQHVRRRKRRAWLMLGTTGEEPTRRAAPGDTVSRLEDRERLEWVYRAADRLSVRKRAVWTLHELEGVSVGRIAEILDIPVNTVRSRLFGARREVKAELQRLGVLDRESS